MSAARGKPIEVYVEIGSKRVFASAADWPGWSRSGGDEGSALEALLEYRERYRSVVGTAASDFPAPTTADLFRVVERLEGGATTDFGVPGEIAQGEWRPLRPSELDRLEGLLKACWQAFKRAVGRAEGKRLRAGARGGGRTLSKMREHVVEAERAYASAVGGSPPRGTDLTSWPAVQERLLEVVRARNRGELPDKGPRGGLRWPARYGLRRAAWHVLDHAWEIEDRTPGDQSS
jgi:hypothetical protein